MADVVLVTGARGGIGREVARQLAATGADVILTARTGADAEAAADGLTATIRPMELDVTSGAG